MKTQRRVITCTPNAALYALLGFISLLLAARFGIAHEPPGRKTNNLEDGLALYYSFDDDKNGKVYDLSGHDVSGRTIGDVQYVESFQGRAARFSSNKTYIISDNFNCNGWKQVSVSAWIKTNKIRAHAQVLSCGAVTDDETSGFTLQVGGTSKAAWTVKTQLLNRTPDGQRLYSSSLLPHNIQRVGHWVHVAATFDGTNLSLYINGKLDKRSEVSNFKPHIWHPKSHKLVVGQTSSKSRIAWLDKYFDGLVDEVKIWRRGLSDDEVQQLYQDGNQKITAHERAVRQRFQAKQQRDKDLVVYYSFDDDKDGTVYDLSGNGNHANTVGAVSYERSFRGHAPRFTSNKTYVLSDAPGLNMHGWRQVTVSAWIKTNRVTTYSRIVNRGAVTTDDGGGVGLQAGSSISKASFGMLRQFQSNRPVQEAIYTSSLHPSNMNRVGRWVHIVGTFDGQFMRIYIDGRLDRQAEASSRHLKIWDSESNKLVIGNSGLKSRMRWSDKYFDGLIDEVKIWRRCLSADEIQQLYQTDVVKSDVTVGIHGWLP